MEVEELFAAKEIFFDRVGVKENHSRARKLVYARTAFANAFKGYAGPSEMGRVMGKDHATIIHYKKVHSDNLKYEDYKELFDKAIVYAVEVVGQEETHKLDSFLLLKLIKELRQEIRILKENNDKLYIFKEKFFKLKELL